MSYFFCGAKTKFRGYAITLIGYTTVGRTPLDEKSARHKDLYLTNTSHSQEKNIYTPAAFEPTIPASELPQTHALDREVNGIGMSILSV